MLRIRIFAGLAAVGLLISPLPALAQASFQGLGDLPGGAFNSSARAVSADGFVIAGYGVSTSGREAFAWTADLSQRLFKGKEAAAGMKAFLKREKAPWAP